MNRLIAVLPLLIAGTAHAEMADWALDGSHTTVGFTIPHLVISSVEGRFKEANGKVNLDEADITKSQVSVEINAASIDTGDQKRDDPLRSPDFFDVKKFPKLSFKSTKVRKSETGYKLTGDLTIRDVTKSVVLDATLTAPIKGLRGNQVRGAKLTGKLKRSDFGLVWNKALEAGGVVIGEEVTLNVSAEVTK